MAVYTPPSGLKRDNYLADIERFRAAEELRTSVRYNSEMPLDKMKQYVKGMKWEVEYFTQIIDINDITSNLDLRLNVSNQMYTRISKLPIYVESGLNQTNINELSVEGVINSKFLPKTGDMFVANLIGGRIGLFRVDNVDIEHYNLHQVYKVEFKIHSFLESNPELYNNLISKVVKNYVYNKDFLEDNSDMLLTREEYSLVDDMKSAIEDITEYYFRTFLDRDTKLLKLPMENERIVYVDQEVEKFCKKIFSVIDVPELGDIQSVDYEMDKSVRYTVWDLILERNIRLLDRLEKNIGFTVSPYTNSNLNSLHVKYMNIHYIVDKVEVSSEVIGVEDTKREVDVGITRYERLTSVKERDKVNSKKASGVWNLVVPTLDFTVIEKKDKENITVDTGGIGKDMEIGDIMESPKSLEELLIEAEKQKLDTPKKKIENIEKTDIVDVLHPKEKVEEKKVVCPIDSPVGYDPKQPGDTFVPKKIEKPILKLDDLNPIVPKTEVKEESSSMSKPKAWNQPIKASKQYSLLRKKRDNT